MHQAGAVGGGQRTQHRFEQVERAGRGQRGLVADDVAQRGPRDVLHDEVRRAGAGVSALVVDGDDLRAGQPGGRARLTGEAVDEVGVLGQRRAHHLDRDGAVEPQVACPVDAGHPAPGDHRVEAVAPVEQASDEGVLVSRRPHAGGRIHDGRV